MWNRLAKALDDRKSNDRWDDEPVSPSSRRRTESIVTSSSGRKPSSATRGDDRDRSERVYIPTSTSYASTLSSTVGRDDRGRAGEFDIDRERRSDRERRRDSDNFQSRESARVVSTSSGKSGKERSSKDSERRRDRGHEDERGSRRGDSRKDRDYSGSRDWDRDQDRRDSKKDRERSGSRDRRDGKRTRSRSRDRAGEAKDYERDEKRRDRRGTGTGSNSVARGKEERRGERVGKDQGVSRAGPPNGGGNSAQASGTFSAQVGGQNFTPFPGQIPNQSAAPFRPPLSVDEGGPGLAADYYGDQGQSVLDQPGVRPKPPSVIVGAEPHLMPASPMAAPPVEPSAIGGVGAAADYFSGASGQPPLSSSKPSGTSSKPGKPNGISGSTAAAAAAAGSAAIGFAAGAATGSGPSGNSASFYQQGSNPPSISTSGYPPPPAPSSTGYSSAPPSNTYPPPPIPASTIYPSGYPPASAPAPGAGHHFASPVAPALGAAAAGAAVGYLAGHSGSASQQHQHGSSSSYSPQPAVLTAPSNYISASSTPSASVRPPKNGKHSSNSNTGLYLAGAAALGTAALAHQHHQGHHSQSAEHHPVTGSSQSVDTSGGGALSLYPPRRRGAVGRLVDFWKDPEGVAKFEQYTEAIGVCKYCFEAGSTPRDAPRKHHYHSRRRGSNERLVSERYSSSSRIDKDSRYSSSDNTAGHRHRARGKKSLIATGLGVYGLAKLGKSLFGQSRDFSDNYSVRSGRSTGSGSWSFFRRRRSRSPDQKRLYGVITQSRSRSRSRDRTSHHYGHRSRDRKEIGITRDGQVYKKETHNGLFGGTVTTVVDPSKPKHRHRRSKSRSRSNSPRGEFARPRRRSSGRYSPQSRGSTSNINRSSTGSIFGGFFSSRSEKKHPVRTKKRGFFNFGNSSSSSSDSGLFYGYGSDRRRRRTSESTKRKDRRGTDAVTTGLGSAAAILVANEIVKSNRDRKGKGRSENAGKKDSSHRRHSSRRSSSSSSSSEDEWESEDDSSSDSGLAFGSFAGSRSTISRRSQESLRSDSSSGTGNWLWPWIGKKHSKKRKSSGSDHQPGSIGHEAPFTVPSTGSFVGTTTGAAVGAATGATFATSGRGEALGGTQNDLQNVHPISTPDPTIFDATKHGSVSSSQSQPILTSRSTSIPIQQPKPFTPVSQVIYSSQPAPPVAVYSNQGAPPAVYHTQSAPNPPTYTTPSGPPVFSSIPPIQQPRQDKVVASTSQTRPPTDPFQYQVKDDSFITRGEEKRIPKISPTRRMSSPTIITVKPPASSVPVREARDPTTGVRFELTQEQTERQNRDKGRPGRRSGSRDSLERTEVAGDRARFERERVRLANEEKERLRLQEQTRTCASATERDREERGEAERIRTQEQRQIRASADDERLKREQAETDVKRKQREEDIEREKRLRQRELERAVRERKSSGDWATPAAVGAIGAVVGMAAAGSAASRIENQYEVEKNRDRDQRQKAADRSDRNSRPRNDSQTDRQTDIARKAAAKVIADRSNDDYNNVPSVLDKYKEKDEPVVVYVAPPELLEKMKGKPDPTPTDWDGHYDAHGHDGYRDPAEHAKNIVQPSNAQIYHAPEIVTTAPKEPPYSPGYSFSTKDEIDDSYMPLPWPIPDLNLIHPTPPGSVAGGFPRGPVSVPGTPAMTPVLAPVIPPSDVPPIEPTETKSKPSVSEVGQREPEKKQYSSKGSPNTHGVAISDPPNIENRETVIVDSPKSEKRRAAIVDAPKPEKREKPDPLIADRPANRQSAKVSTESVKESTIPRLEEKEANQMPGSYGEDIEFATTLARGLQESGFDPAIVIGDQSYYRRESPPGSEEEYTSYKRTSTDPRSYQPVEPSRTVVTSYQKEISDSDAGEEDTEHKEQKLPGQYVEYESKPGRKLSKKEQTVKDKEAKRQPALGKSSKQPVDTAPRTLDGPIIAEPESYYDDTREKAKKPKKSKRDSVSSGSRDSRDTAPSPNNGTYVVEETRRKSSRPKSGHSESDIIGYGDTESTVGTTVSSTGSTKDYSESRSTTTTSSKKSRDKKDKRKSSREGSVSAVAESGRITQDQYSKVHIPPFSGMSSSSRVSNIFAHSPQGSASYRY
jgi:hypothetical protein